MPDIRPDAGGGTSEAAGGQADRAEHAAGCDRGKALSRSQSIALFREKKVFVNGYQMENNSGTLKEQDVVSVRGYGKLICDGISGETKKGNLNIQVSKYV